MVSVEAFSAARNAELQAMCSELTDRREGKRVMQKLAHHLQRRQMSFRPSSYPVSLRRAAQRELDKLPALKKPVPKRRFRRRSAVLPRRHAARKAEERLASHVWHAKRFSMRSLWGMTLPWKSVHRGQRAAYKAMRHTAVVHDASYEAFVRVSGPLQLVAHALDRCAHANAFSAALHASGARAGRVMLHDPSDEPVMRPVAPVTFFWRPQQQQQQQRENSEIMINVHASAGDEVEEVLKKLFANAASSVTVERVQHLGKIELLGPSAHQVLMQVLEAQKPAPFDRLQKCVSATELPNSAVIGITVNDPRVKKRPSPQNRPNAAIPTPQHESGSQILSWPATGECAVADSIWERNAEAPEPQGELDARRHVDQSLQGKGGVELLLIQRPGLSNAQSTPVASSLGFGSGYSIILPKSWCVVLWHLLVKTAALPVGIKDMMRLWQRELCVPVFPCDFPETRAGAAWEAAQADKRLAKLLARPPGKRSDAAILCLTFPPHAGPEALRPYVLRSPNAAVPPSNAALVMVPVRIESVRDGVVEPHALLCDPAVASGSVDVKKRRKLVQQRGEEEIVHEQKQVLLQQSVPPVPLGSESSAVGFATGGGLSGLRGQGSGIGCVTLSYLQSLNVNITQNFNVEVAVRNPASGTYRMARLTPSFNML